MTRCRLQTMWVSKTSAGLHWMYLFVEPVKMTNPDVWPPTGEPTNIALAGWDLTHILKYSFCSRSSQMEVSMKHIELWRWDIWWPLLLTCLTVNVPCGRHWWSTFACYFRLFAVAFVGYVGLIGLRHSLSAQTWLESFALEDHSISELASGNLELFGYTSWSAIRFMLEAS